MLAEDALQALAHFVVFVGQHGSALGQQGDLAAQQGKVLGELQLDAAAAPHQQALGGLVQGQGLAGGQQPGQGDGRLALAGAGSQDDGIAFQARPSLDLHAVRAHQARLPFHHLDAKAVHQRADAHAQLFDDAVHVGARLGQVQRGRAHLHAQVARPADALQQLDAGQHPGKGDAVVVDAGAAQVALIDQGDLGAQLGRPRGGRRPTRPAADDDDVSHESFSLSPLRREGR